MTPEAKKHCEELAEHLVKTRKVHAVMGYGTPEAFKDGFQAGYSYNEDRLRIAIEALEHIYEYWNRDANEQATLNMSQFATDKAREAIAKIRGEK